MSEARDVLPVNTLVGKAVLSLSSGNKLGPVSNVFIDPLNGVVIGLAVSSSDGASAGIPYSEIHSFGHDAIMAVSDASIQPAGKATFLDQPNADQLIGTKIITESGNILGEIAGIFVTASQPPFVIYEVRESLLDRLFGRRIYIPASAGFALSDDRQRLVVPDATSELASPTIEALFDGRISVRTVSASEASSKDLDDTVVITLDDDGDETVLRINEDEETVVRLADDDDSGDETIVRLRRS